MGTGQFVVTAEAASHGYTMRWAGEVDIQAAESALRSVTELDLRAGDVLRLALDTVTFMDSTGVRCLLEARRHLDATGGQLLLVDPSPRVVRVLELTGVKSIFAPDGAGNSHTAA